MGNANAGSAGEQNPGTAGAPPTGTDQKSQEAQGAGNAGAQEQQRAPRAPRAPRTPAAAAGTQEKAQEEAAGLTPDALAGLIANAVAQGITAGMQANAQVMKEALAEVLPKKDDEDLPETPEDREAAKSELEAQLAEERFLITIAKGDKNALDPVPIGVNGPLRTVKRGEFAVVTASMLEVLRNSEETHIDPETQEPYGVSSYPYTVHARVPKELWELPAADVAKQLVGDLGRPH